MKINKSAKHLSNLAHASMTPEQRSARAKKASAKRWAGHIKPEMVNRIIDITKHADISGSIELNDITKD